MSTQLQTRPVYFDVDPLNAQAAPGKGYFNAPYAIVGIAPSPNRPLHRRNEPFGAKSYKMLKALIEMVGEENLYTTNLVKTPIDPGVKPSRWELQYWYPALRDELRFMGIQRRVLALGVPVAEVLCPGFGGMRNDHGVPFWNPDLNLYVMPTYHFSAIGRDPSLLPILHRDIERFFTLPDPVEPQAIELPHLADELFEYLEQHGQEFHGRQLIIDIETRGRQGEEGETGLSYHAEIQSIGLMLAADHQIPYVIMEPEELAIRVLLEYLKKHDVTLIGHNLAFDLARLTRKAKMTWMKPVEDTLLIAHTRGEMQLGLKHLTTLYTDRPGSHAFGSFESAAYLAEDVLSTYGVYRHYCTDGKPRTPIMDLLGRLVPVFAAMENRGVYIDPQRLAELKIWAKDEIEQSNELLTEYSQEYTGHAYVNWNSPVQVSKALQAAGVPLSKKTETGNLSVNEQVLLEHREAHPIVDALLKYRESIKQEGFLEQYTLLADEHWLLHPSGRLFGAETGRLSYRDPNLQQVPRTGPIKQLFVNRTPGGSIGLCDLAQAELRVAALLSNDEQLAQALKSGDVHLTIASQIYRVPPEEVGAARRKKSKGVTFGLLYGGSEEGLAKRVGVPVQEVFEIVNGFYGIFKDLKKWLDMMGEFGVEHQYVTTPMGRFRNLSYLMIAEGPRSVRRKAVNTPIQGTASDIMLMVLDGFASEILVRKLRSRPLFPVHDSLVMEIAPGEERAVADALASAFARLNDSPLSTLPLWRDLPLEGELKIARSWATAESTNEAYAPESEFPMSTHQ